MVRLIKMADPPPYGQLFVIFFGIHSTLDLYIIGRFCLSVCLSRKMITFPNGLKSSSLALAISFFKHCYKKMFSMSCRGQQFFFELLIF